MPKLKKCNKGYNCGYSCIHKDKKCRNPIAGSSASSAVLTSAAKKLEKPSGKLIGKPSISESGATVQKQGYKVSHGKLVSTPFGFSIQTQLKYPTKTITLYSALDNFAEGDDLTPLGQELANLNMHIYQFTVDRDHSASSENSEYAISIASAVAEDFKRIMASAPEGVVIGNSPYNGDGKGKNRAAIYKRIGFSDAKEMELSFDEPSAPFQMATKKGDRLMPYEM